MILTTYSEDEVLSELLKDYLILSKKIQKIANDFLYKTRKAGRFIRETDYDVRSFQTASHNKWNVGIEYNQTNRASWCFKACCIVEGDKKTKDYYIVRGAKTENPYFVKVTSHAAKRIIERSGKKRLELDLDYAPLLTFEHREIAICMKYIDMKYNKILLDIDETEEIDDMSYIVLTNRGSFFAKKTKGGNYIFKTFISSLMSVTEVMKFQHNVDSKYGRQGELLTLMMLLHQYYNKHLWDKDLLEEMLYSAMNKDDQIMMREKEIYSLLKY